jgi:hypothetical protein
VYDEGSSDSAEEFKKALQRDPRISIIPGKIKQDVYIGTDTRYVIELSDHQQIVSRVQNFGLRSDTYFDAGHEVNIYWNAENARILQS